MQKYLLEMMSMLKKRTETLKFDEAFEPEKSSQNILRNLGCSELCMKIASFINGVNQGDNSEETKSTRRLCLLCNHLIYWFVYDNPMNQQMLFKHLKHFISTIEMKVDSEKVIRAIFINNINLMESVPRKYIADFVELICVNGRQPQYLALMSSIIAVGEKNVIRNQYEVIKLMSNPENQKRVVQYFVPVTHPEYSKKVRLMSTHLEDKDVMVDALPPDLAYHLDLMGLLSSCTLGKSGMTSIEAKVQSMFDFVDIIEHMLDPNCLLLAKIRLGLFLFNAVVDVETLLPAFKDADCIWRLIISSEDVFTFAKEDLRAIEKRGWDHADSNRQRVEYVVVCTMIIHGYFSYYYDNSIFKIEVGQANVGVEKVQIKEFHAQEIIKSLFQKIGSIYEMLSPLLTFEHHNLLHECLVSLNNAAKEPFVAAVEDIHTSHLEAAAAYKKDNGGGDGKLQELVDELEGTIIIRRRRI